MTHLLFLGAVFALLYYHPRNPSEAVVQRLPWQGSAMDARTCALLLLTLTTLLWFA
ncbi:MAG: hypothetical protein J0L73_04980 [Verrucomicrobia bacterium]|nr:hypothetical protein [Verrucomicrobiota bacterium]